MSTRGPGNKFLIGLLIGAGLGVASVLLVNSVRASRRRVSPFRTLGVTGDRLASLRTARRAERANRTLMNRVGRIRSAGL